MVATFQDLHPVIQALIATLFTWLLTALGAAVVFLFRELPRKTLDAMLGFAGGVMIAASYWSLLAPAIELSGDLKVPAWVPPAAGFLAGGLFLWISHRLLPHIHLTYQEDLLEGQPSSLNRVSLFFLAITLHNIPEGLAVGVAFGVAACCSTQAGIATAVALAIGIGLQNFPEGAATALPYYREGFSRLRSFFYGQLSGVVEPMAGVVGAALVLAVKPLLPYAQGFAAGAMIFVVIQEVIPESQSAGNRAQATLGGMLGFVVMMILDVALG